MAGFGIVLAALPALGAGRLWTAWVFFWTIFVVLAGVDAVLAMRGSALSTELSLPETLHVGAPEALVLTLGGLAARRAPVELRLDLSDTLTPQPAQRARASDSGARFTVPILPLRRGLAEIEAAWARYTGPLGIMLRSVRIPLGRRASVVPNLPSVRAAAVRFWSPREYAAGLKIERFVGDGTEFDCLREFLPGFDRRSVDWRASARHTKLLCRQFRAERSHQIVLVVDTGRLMAEPLGDPAIPRLDHAVHAGLLLAYMSARTGDRVGLFAFDERPRLFAPPRAGNVAFRALLEESANLDYSTAETNYTLGLTELMSRLTRRSLVIVLTDFVDTVTAELMIENVRRLSRRHLVVFVALRDPMLAEIAGRAPSTMVDLNRAIVADSFLRERDLVLTRLRRQGVFCIDAPPTRVGVDLVNRYLEIKRRELI